MEKPKDPKNHKPLTPEEMDKEMVENYEEGDIYPYKNTLQDPDEPLPVPDGFPLYDGIGADSKESEGDEEDALSD